MQREKIWFGILGLGLMGKEFASAVARWRHLVDDKLPIPIITGVCDTSNESSRAWFINSFESIKVSCTDNRDLLASDEIDNNTITDSFRNVTPEETLLSHRLLTVPLESNETGRRISLS